MTTYPNQLVSYRFLPIILILLIGLNGCATMSTDESVNVAPADKIYADGRAALLSQDYKTASNYFRSLEANYPDSPYNHQAQMELAYAYFKAGDFSSSIATTDRLIKNYPDSDNLDYSLYLKALASFEQTAILIEQENDADSAVLAAQTSLRNFDDLSTQFPNSKYQQDADKRVAYLQEQLAQHEVAAARRDIELGNHASAVVHARNVIENYPVTQSAAEALAIVDMGYEIMAIGNPGADTTATSVKSSESLTDSETDGFIISPDTDLKTASIEESGFQATKSIQATIEPEPVPEPTIQRNIPVHSPKQLAGAQSSDWILNQGSDQYTIQLISTLKDDTLSQFINHHNLNNQIAYYRKRVNGQVWHTLVYGIYSNISDARAAIDNLPESIRNGKPWVMRLDAVQNAIKNFNSNS